MFSPETEKWVLEIEECKLATRDQMERFISATSEQDFREYFEHFLDQSGSPVEDWLKLVEDGEPLEDLADFVNNYWALLPYYKTISELRQDFSADVIDYFIDNYGEDELVNFRSSIQTQNCLSLDDYCLREFVEVYQVPEEVARYLNASKIEQDYGDDLDLYHGYVFRI